jgi:hypothetical protein
MIDANIISLTLTDKQREALAWFAKKNGIADLNEAFSYFVKSELDRLVQTATQDITEAEPEEWADLPPPSSGKELVEMAQNSKAPPDAWRELGERVQEAREKSIGQ